MSAIDTLRDALFGNPPSSTYKPSREGVLAAFTELNDGVSNIALASMLTVFKATRALLDADLVHGVDSVALVYDDGTDANNDIYIKVGASGAGSWTRTDAFHTIIAGLIDPKVEEMETLIRALTLALTDATDEIRELQSLQMTTVTFDRYLDTVTGDDAFNGLSENTAKKTMPGIVAMGSLNNISIGIARGSIVRSNNDLTGNNVRVGIYGAIGTPRPVLDPSIALVPSGWAAHGTYAGMWTQTVAGFYVEVNMKNIGNVVWLDRSTGKYYVLKQYPTKAALNAAPSGVYVNAWNLGTMAISLKPGTKFGDPGKSGQEYRVTDGYGLRIIGTGNDVSDVILQNAAEQNGALDLGGDGSTARRITCLNGSRHNSLFGANALIEDSYFAGGDNQLESGQGPNGAVVFTIDFAGKSFTFRRCVFEDNDLNVMQAIYSHDAVNTGAPLPYNVEDCTFIGVYSCVEQSVAGSLGIVTRPTFKNRFDGKISYHIGTFAMNVHYASGKISMLADGATQTQSYYDCDLHIADMGAGARQAFMVGGAAIRYVRCKFLVDPIVRSYSGHENSFTRLSSGSLHVEGTTFKMDGQFNTALFGCDLTGALAWTGGGNRWPYGTRFLRNGTTYGKLSAAQAAGYEAGSTSEPIPTPLVASNFSAVANGNLEGVTGWSKLIGPAGASVVASNKVGPAMAANAAYKRGQIPAAGGYVRFKVRGLNDHTFVAQRITNNGDHYLGCSAWADGHVQVWYLTPTTYNRPVYGPVVSIGDDVLFVTRVLDETTGNMGIWIYVNDIFVAYSEYADLVIASATNVGCASVGYNVAGDCFSDFSAGPLE